MSSANEKFEREFEKFLDGEDSSLAALYRKLPPAEPDARLDAAVLAMAHRALNPELVATPSAHARRRRARWLPALGAAAGLVLAAGVALRVGPQIWNERNPSPTSARNESVIQIRPLDEPPPPPPASPPPPSAAPEAATAGAASPTLQMGRMAPAKPAPTPAPLARPVQPQAANSAAAVNAEPATAQKVENAASAPGAARPFPGAKTQPEMDAVERQQAVARGAWWQQRKDETDALKGGAVSADTSESGKKQKAGAPVEAAQAAAMAAPAVAPTAAAAPPPAQAATADGAESRAKAVQTPTPAEWIKRIRAQLHEQHREQAMRELEQFRRRYPDYLLPVDLRDLR